MYKKILVAIDNSRHSDHCIDLGIKLSKNFNSLLVGCHVYDASLHQRRFRDMEKGLPQQYQDEPVLQRQRDLHTSLINQGLKLISESYLDVFEKKCREAAVPHKGLLLEGKNYFEIIKEVQGNHYDLVIMGAQGLAAVDSRTLGSVCERVVRRIKTDIIVVKNNCFEGKAVVAVDGSTQSVAGVKSAISVTQRFNLKLDAVSVYDPHYHRVAFESIAKVLSKEAGQIFRFKEQETLHEEIIDKGLAKIYQGHLDRANHMAKDAGVEINSILMDGKPYDQILKFIFKEQPSLLIVGRTGVHNTNGLDIGSTTENLLRLSPCNILLTGENLEAARGDTTVGSEFQRVSIHRKDSAFISNSHLHDENRFEEFTESAQEIHEKPTIKAHDPVVWTQEAQIQTERIPSFIRNMIRIKIENYAWEKGYKEITTKIVDEAKSKLMSDTSFHKI
ncbi:MAG TPA: universal stress protein [Candidatus Brocadiaceae bacterium]|nr:universal stress protein [Candidatus Brocadiaceae bacterium]